MKYNNGLKRYLISGHLLLSRAFTQEADFILHLNILEGSWACDMMQTALFIPRRPP